MARPIEIAMLGLLALVERDLPCPPAAALEGEPTLVQGVGRALEHRGITSTAPQGCERLEVEVSGAAERVALRIAANGTSVDRVAHSFEEAATIVASWARQDVTGSLLQHDLPPDVRRPVAVADPERPAAPRLPTPPVPAPRPFGVSVGGVVGFAGDGSKWSGLDVRGCFQVSYVCLGGRVQYAVDLGMGGEADRLGGGRSLFDLHATADVPWVIGDFEIVPGVGVGQGILTTRREVDAGQVNDDTGGLRLRGQLGGSWRFADRWSLRVEGAVDYAPFARPRIFESLVDDGPENVQLAGEPSAMGWMRLALELGGL